MRTASLIFFTPDTLVYNFLFPDSKGNLCQDRMELIQDTEYETMIQCRVAMTKSCEDNTIEDTITKSEEACHTVYEKECKTVYRPHRSKVRHI